jgi:hypothetical protein
LEELKAAISEVVLSEVADCWCWRPANDAIFTVNSAYLLVSQVTNTIALETPWHGNIFKAIWQCPAPSKVVGFV